MHHRNCPHQTMFIQVVAHSVAITTLVLAFSLLSKSIIIERYPKKSTYLLPIENFHRFGAANLLSTTTRSLPDINVRNHLKQSYHHERWHVEGTSRRVHLCQSGCIFKLYAFNPSGNYCTNGNQFHRTVLSPPGLLGRDRKSDLEARSVRCMSVSPSQLSAIPPAGTSSGLGADSGSGVGDSHGQRRQRKNYLGDKQGWSQPQPDAKDTLVSGDKKSDKEHEEEEETIDVDLDELIAKWGELDGPVRLDFSREQQGSKGKGPMISAYGGVAEEEEITATSDSKDRKGTVETVGQGTEEIEYEEFDISMAAAIGQSDLGEEELAALIERELEGPKHKEELNRKVEEAMQQEWDITQGVDTMPKKPKPLKANLDLWSYQAKQLMLKGDFTSAAKFYEKCTAYDPCDGRAWLGLARIYWKKGQVSQAERAYTDGLYYCPKNPYLLQSWAIMLEKRGELSRAQQLLVTAVKSSPGHSASWVALAKLHMRNGDVGAAKSCYQTAAENDPCSYVTLQAWGVLEAESGNVDSARELFQRALQIAPTSQHAIHAWANMEVKSGNFSGAELLFKRAMGKRDTSTRLVLSYAELLERQGAAPNLIRECLQRAEGRAQQVGDAGLFQARAMLELRLLSEMRGRHARLSRAHEWQQAADLTASYSNSDSSLGSDSNNNNRASTIASASRTVEGYSSKVAEAIDSNAAQQRMVYSATSDNGRYSAASNEAASFDGQDLILETEVEAEETEREAEEELSPEQLRQQRQRTAKALLQLEESMAQQAASIRRYFQRAVKVNKYHSASWVAWAQFEQKSGNLDVARRLLINGIANFPHSRHAARFHHALGSLARQQGDLSTARACYQRALDSSAPQHSLPILLEFAAMEATCGKAVTIGTVGSSSSGVTRYLSESMKGGGNRATGSRSEVKAGFAAARKLLQLAEKRFPGDRQVLSALEDLNLGVQKQKQQ